MRCPGGRGQWAGCPASSAVGSRGSPPSEHSHGVPVRMRTSGRPGTRCPVVLSAPSDRACPALWGTGRRILEYDEQSEHFLRYRHAHVDRDRREAARPWWTRTVGGTITDARLEGQMAAPAEWASECRPHVRPCAEGSPPLRRRNERKPPVRKASRQISGACGHRRALTHSMGRDSTVETRCGIPSNIFCVKSPTAEFNSRRSSTAAPKNSAGAPWVPFARPFASAPFRVITSGTARRRNGGPSRRRDGPAS